MLIGYARVSTYEQNLTLQTDALKKAGCRKIFDDKISGAKSARPGLGAALEYVRKGDTLLVWRLDRLGRSLKDLIEIIAGLERRGVGFRSLQVLEVFGQFAFKAAVKTVAGKLSFVKIHEYLVSHIRTDLEFFEF